MKNPITYIANESAIFSLKHDYWLLDHLLKIVGTFTAVAVGNSLKTGKAHAGNITFLFLPYLLQSLNDFCINPIKNTRVGLGLGQSPLIHTQHLWGYFEPASQFYHASIFFPLKSPQETLRCWWKPDHVTVLYLWLSLAVFMK